MTKSFGDRPRVLYVAGIPRTGSTVLGLLLGGMPNVLFVGELNFFWRRFAHGHLCSCRRPLPDCPFWTAVVHQAYGDLTHHRAKELAELERQVLRKQFLLGLAPASWPVRTDRRVGMMLTELVRLYQSIGQLTGASWIVDTGKEPVFGTFLARADGVDLSTIHLVRDPRGVAFSWTKQIPSDSEPRDMPRKPAAATALDWMLQNMFVHLTLPRLSRAYVRVRYEDLTASRADVLRQIAQAIGLPMVSPTAAGDQRAVGMPGQHLVAGNPAVRQVHAGNLPLRLDEEWRTRLPRSQQRIVTAMCASLMSRYGYPLRSA
ncbi:MAG: hypothetical protein C5B60_05985 [Chloroflexi bacterium]|nr:MAG: hypothetical protein C5B60_05985 [Chloroflexota bacterium]